MAEIFQIKRGVQRDKDWKAAVKNVLIQKQNVNIDSAELSKTVKSQIFFHVEAKIPLFFKIKCKFKVRVPPKFSTGLVKHTELYLTYNYQ